MKKPRDDERRRVTWGSGEPSRSASQGDEAVDARELVAEHLGDLRIVRLA